MSQTLSESLPSLDFLQAERERGLNSHGPHNLGAFSASQNRAILVVGVTSASISLLAALLALRWFLLMRRSFRHHLILFLILSDTFKSIWYFVFPIVSFTKGPVNSTSDFCQASGFLLAYGLESSDYAIFAIALHAILHIFQPLRNSGDGGLHPYRWWIYAFWVALPTLAASLGFINSETAYVTAGTFCYLPKRPFWYRLALAWIPRYLIFAAILGMYATIYVYVHIKFRGFSNLAAGDSRYGSRLGSEQISGVDQEKGRKPPEIISPKRSSKATLANRLQIASANLGSPTKPSRRAPWEDVNFITTKALQDVPPHESHGISTADFAPEPGTSSAESSTPIRRVSIVEADPNAFLLDNRKGSEAPTLATNFTGETATTETSLPLPTNDATRSTDQLNLTRMAIRRQLRFLFIYPAVYILMWTFPFASHCLQYSDYYAAHPPFWLSLVATAMLALQGGADCVVFSWREKPWRRVDDKSPFTMTSILSRMGISRRPGKTDESSPCSTMQGESYAEAEGSKRDSYWWEAEGSKRKDSVWMGTDTLNQIISRQDAAEEGAEHK